MRAIIMKYLLQYVCIPNQKEKLQVLLVTILKFYYCKKNVQFFTKPVPSIHGARVENLQLSGV